LDISSFSIEILSFLFFIAVTASFIDTLAGGGGLLTIPALIMNGIPPLFALGTNKMQSSMGSATATFMMLRKRKITFDGIKRVLPNEEQIDRMNVREKETTAINPQKKKLRK
jgi:hypothetical protein